MLPLLTITLSAARAGDRPPDVILLSVDTLRADHVRALSPDSPASTPMIDALAADGVRYTQAFSPISVTAPAFASVMTGRDLSGHGVVMNVFVGGRGLPSELETLAERLSGQGYATGAFVSGFTLREQSGLSQGFDVYRQPEEEQPRIPGTESAQAARSWLEQQDSPLLLWFHTYDTHGPLEQWEAPPADARWARDAEQLRNIVHYQRIDEISDPEFYARRYASAVAQADQQIGTILDALRQSGRYDDALIIFLSDHGEELDDHEMWFAHGNDACEAQLHVPLVVKLPGQEHADTEQDALVALQDVAPTVLDVLGLPDLQGTSGSSLLRPPRGRAVFGESSHCKPLARLSCAPHGPDGKTLSVRTSRQAVIRESTEDGVVFRHYDRRTDPGEQHPLSQPPPAHLVDDLNALAELRESMPLGWIQQFGLPKEEPVETYDALRELGYVE